MAARRDLDWIRMFEDLAGFLNSLLCAKSTTVKLHGNDIIIVHVISMDAQTNQQTNRCNNLKQS